MFDKKIQSGKVNYHNIVVFDETIIGDSVTVPVVIGQRRNSGGNNNNVVHTRQARLGCYIPFSMPDGTTPFRVFIFNDKDLDDSGSTFRVLTPKKEKGYRGDPVRLYLSSGTGFLNKALFEYIIIQFAKWWKGTQGAVDCFLISDNLPIHTNCHIKTFAKSMGIHMKNTTPGTSHWFQVHDQQPFGALKKKMTQQKFDFWTATADPVEDGATLLTCLFYQAETDAFESQVLRKTFADVGLWPWNPLKILQNCEEHCPTEPPVKESRLVKKLLKIINSIDEEKRRLLQQLKEGMKEERVISQNEAMKKIAFERKITKKLFGDWRRARARRIKNAKNRSTESPARTSDIPKRGCGRPRKNS